MEKPFESPYWAYMIMTKELLELDRLTPLSFSFSIENFDYDVFGKERSHFKNIFKQYGNAKYKGGERLDWVDTMIDSVFPTRLFERNERDLEKLMSDPNFVDPPSYKRASHHNFIGRMSRNGFLRYTIDRWKMGPAYRNMPHFYFDVESPSWVFEELIKNQRQIKTGRTSVSCVMNISMRYDSKKDKALLFLILKHNQWSHLIGDVYGAAIFWHIFLQHVEIPCSKGQVFIFAISSVMDDQKRAREVISNFDNNFIGRVARKTLRRKCEEKY